MERVIDVKNLKKSFNGKHVLRDVNLYVNRNENLVLLGKSGSGKSVLMKIIVGLIDHDHGKVVVLNKEVGMLNEKELIEYRKEVGYVFQEGALYDSMTVGENISFSLERQWTRKQRKNIPALVDYALDSVGLLHAIDKMPNELSGGMKKRVALARTLVLRPKIILYDEPTAGLDPVTSKEIIRLILHMKQTHGISSIIATHDLICTRMTADRIIVLHEGIVGAEGSYEELENSDTDWVKSFFV